MGLLFPAKGAQLRGGGEAHSLLHRARLPPSNRNHEIWRTQGLENVPRPPSILLPKSLLPLG